MSSGARRWGGHATDRFGPIGPTTDSERDAIFARLDRTISRRNEHSGGLLMLNSKAFDDLAARIGQAIENSPAKDIEQNVKAMLSSGLARLDVVPRAEFEVQAQVLLKTREKLEALEARLAEIEKRLPAGKTE
jgi:BMFP domain-containing protein YqiC